MPRNLHPQRNTSLLFGRFDAEGRDLADPLWLVPSLHLPRVARRHYCVYHRFSHWQFRANVREGARDLASPYRVEQRGLASALFPSLQRQRAAASQQLSPIAIEKGGFFELGFATRFFRESRGQEKLLKPETDFGRDLLAVRFDPFAWASLAIKGRASLTSTGVLHVRIPGRTFIAHRRHFILIQYFDEARQQLHPVSWLIPSLTFARLASHSGGDHQWEITLKSAAANRWARYAIPSEADAATFMRWMRRPPAA